MRRALVKLIVITAAVAALGCDSRVQHGLDERQANEIQSVLVQRGFDAKKAIEPGKKPTWAIEVDEEEAADAVRVLNELGLPRPKMEGFSEVFGKGNLVTTPTEERALFVEALSGEIARTLESVEGVTSARVQLVLPSAARPGQPSGVAKAAALLRVGPGEADRVGQQRAELRALVAGSVEGLSPDSVVLVINEVSTQVAPPVHAVSPLRRLRALVMVLGAALSVLAILMVVLTARLRHFRTAAARPAPAAPPRPIVNPSPARKAA
ncbi:MAG TPA: flagellar M-ring protein FliF [Myxococcaceae bacterium]|nr:flagellar M-ring protein FliF [Myxococcaceae bacterium]